MLVLLVLWVALFAMLAGWGLVVTNVWRRFGIKETPSSYQLVWLGYAAFIAVLQFWSLVAPVAMASIVMSWFVAMAGFILERRVVLRWLRSRRWRSREAVVIALVVIAIWFLAAYESCDLVTLYDTGLYHQQIVKWRAQFGTPFGLANLHLRFGYNNSVHIFGAHVDAYWQGIAAHISNGFLIAVALGQWLSEILSGRTTRGRLRQVFCLLSLPLLLTKLWSVELPSLSSDVPLIVFCSVALLELLSFDALRSRLSLAIAVTLGAVAVSTRLNGLALCVVLLVTALICMRRLPRREWLGFFALPSLIVVGWVVQGVALSGWLIFPAFGHLPLSWSVPKTVAQAHLEQIQSWARMWAKEPGDLAGKGIWFWLGPWLDDFSRSKECIFAFASVALLAWRNVAAGARRASFGVGERAAIVALLLGLVQWFIGAPALRYGGYLFWLLPPVLLAPLLAPLMSDRSRRSMVLIGALVLCVWSGAVAYRIDAKVPRMWGRPPYGAVPELQSITVDGATVHLPSEGDQCWDAELPCTPMPTFRGRRPSADLGAGFLPRD